MVVVVKRVHAADEDGDHKPDPHDASSEKRLDGRVPLPLPDHLHRHLDHRIDQLLVVHPLPAQDHHDADHDEREGNEEEPPVGQGPDPGLPRDGRPLGQPFVELPHRFLVLRGEPPGHVRVDEFRPVVLRGGVVERAGHHGGEKSAEPLGRDRTGHDHHDVNGGQLTGPEGEASFDQSEEEIQDTDEEEEEEERGGRAEVHRHPGSPDDHVRVGRADADEEG